jgi:hypothetical protein
LSSRTDPGALRLAARRFGTPLYLTDLAILDEAAAAIRLAFPDPWLRQFSVKANDVPAVIAAVAARGYGANVVSRGEWAAAKRAGVPNDRITLEGIGKTAADLRAAVRAAGAGDPPRWVAIESPEEAAALAGLARRQPGTRLDVLYRLNPDVAPETIAGLAVGAGASKFGMTGTELAAAIEAGGGWTGRSGRTASTSTSAPSSARSMPGATRSGARWRCWPSCAAGSTRSTPSTSAAASRSARSERPRPRPNASPASCRRCSRRSPTTGAHAASRSSRAASSSPGPAGSSRGCSMSGTAAARRSCSMRA